MAFAAKVKTAAKAVIGAYGASAAAFAAWDYRTMNPTRKYQGWTLDESLVRCRNIMRAPSRKFTPAELEQYNGQGGEASVYFAVRSKGGLVSMRRCLFEPSLPVPEHHRVYDVTPSETFTEAYASFCGKDATVGGSH
jgi:hypothetical protein